MSKLVWLAILLFGFVIGLTLGATYAKYQSTHRIGLSPPQNASLQNSPMPSPTPSTFTIIAVGDIMLGRSVNLQAQKTQDSNWPFYYVAETLKAADLTFANLENPVIEGCPPHDSGFKFCSPPDSLAGLVYAGIDVVSLANNHATNYGPEGLTQTVNLLNQIGINPTGVGQTALFTLNDTTIEFFAYNDVGRYEGINPADPDLIISDLASSSASLKIVSFHWGEEYTASPSSQQIELAHATIEAGADVIIGHHPHWIQSDEIYQDKPIFYSLGNFIFDQMWSEETKIGLAVKLRYQDSELLGITHMPVKIENYGQPKWYSELN